jgi:hypothetical protein
MRGSGRRWMAVALLGLAASGCGLLGGGSVDDVSGTYLFSNEYGYTETIVIRPDFSRIERFGVVGSILISDADGVLSGSGTCTRSSLELVQPDGLEQLVESTSAVSLTGRRSGSSISDFRMSGCAFPRPMEGRVEGGRIVLSTDLGFPVSRGTTLISDRFGDPTRLVMTRQ